MTATFTPSFASAWQMRWPRPPLPPVTTATVPLRSMASSPDSRCRSLADRLRKHIPFGRGAAAVDIGIGDELAMLIGKAREIDQGHRDFLRQRHGVGAARDH